jgi:hypothetical protein
MDNFGSANELTINMLEIMKNRIFLAFVICVIASCLFTYSTAETTEHPHGFDVIQYEAHGNMVFSSRLLEIRKDGRVLWEVGDMMGREVRVGRLPANLLARLQADIASLDIPTNEKRRENCAIAPDSGSTSFTIIRDGKIRLLPDATCLPKTAMKIRAIEDEVLDLGGSVVKPLKY